MELSELFTRGAKLSDVPPDFRGMPAAEFRRKWALAEITRQGKAHLDKLARMGVEPPAWSTRAAATPRDSYGMKSM